MMERGMLNGGAGDAGWRRDRESWMTEQGMLDGGVTESTVTAGRHHRRPASRHNACLRGVRRVHDADTV